MHEYKKNYDPTERLGDRVNTKFSIKITIQKLRKTNKFMFVVLTVTVSTE